MDSGTTGTTELVLEWRVSDVEWQGCWAQIVTTSGSNSSGVGCYPPKFCPTRDNRKQCWDFHQAVIDTNASSRSLLHVFWEICGAWHVGLLDPLQHSSVRQQKVTTHKKCENPSVLTALFLVFLQTKTLPNIFELAVPKIKEISEVKAQNPEKCKHSPCRVGHWPRLWSALQPWSWFWTLELSFQRGTDRRRWPHTHTHHSEVRAAIGNFWLKMKWPDTVSPSLGVWHSFCVGTAGFLVCPGPALSWSLSPWSVCSLQYNCRIWLQCSTLSM